MTKPQITRINIALPSSVHHAARVASALKGQTLKWWITAAIKAAIEAERKLGPPASERESIARDQNLPDTNERRY